MHLPSIVIGTLLGLPTSTYEHFKRWATDLANIPGVADDDLAGQARTRDSWIQLDTYITEVVEDRRRNPRDDFVTDLVRVEVDGQCLPPSVLRGFMNLLLVAGLETTVYLLTLTLQALSDHPEAVTRLLQDRSNIPPFIEEVLRYYSPVQSVLRMTSAELELYGVRLPAGSPILALIGSANRDETRFTEPNRFQPGRTAPTALSFGYGPHFCLGAALARMEARIMLEELLTRFQRFEVKTDRFEWNYSLTMRGPWVLPVELHGA
jgi:cytochrome P450